MIHKKAALLFGIGLITCNCSTKTDIFNDLAPILLREYTSTKDKKQEDHTINLDETTSLSEHQPEQNTNKEIDLNLQPLTEEETIKTYLSLLPHLTKPNKLQKSIYSIKDAEKLNIIAGTISDQSHNLRSILPTQTSVGEICKTITFATPTSNQNILEERQKQIVFLIKNPETLREIKKQLNKIARNEKIFLNYFKKFSLVEKEALNTYYFQSNFFKPINNSRASLNSFYLMTRSLTLAGLVPTQIWMQLQIEILRAYNQTGKIAAIFNRIPEIITNTIKNGIKTTIQQHNPHTNAYKRIENRATNSFHPMPTGKNFASWGDLSLYHEYEITGGQNSNNIFKKLSTKALTRITGIIFTLYIDVITGRSTYLMIQENMRFASILKNFHSKLHAAAKIIHAYDKIQKLIINTPLQYNQTLKMVTATSDPGIKKLVETLQQDRWINKKFSFVSDWGQILATNHKLDIYKAQIAEPLYEIGLLDTIVSAASIFNETKSKNLPICFTSYKNSEQPTLKAVNFWNPLVKKQTEAIKNSIEFLPEKTRGLLLTGPNGSGKSTNTKGIIFNIMLSQTLGIAFAEEFQLTPYTKFITAFNEQEDIAKNLSSFMAEKLQVDTLIKEVDSLSSNERAFVFMDEAVKGTIEEAAGEIILDACLKLAKQPQVNAMVVTHTYAPTEAEDLTNGIFKNYFVEVLEIKPGSGSFIRTFKLKEGKPLWWFSSAKRRKSFITFLSNEENKNISTNP